MGSTGISVAWLIQEGFIEGKHIGPSPDICVGLGSEEREGYEVLVSTTTNIRASLDALCVRSTSYAPRLCARGFLGIPLPSLFSFYNYYPHFPDKKLGPEKKSFAQRHTAK